MPYILNTEKDIKEMFQTIGVASFEELYQQIPSAIRLKQGLNLSSGLSEFEVKKQIKGLAGKNIALDQFNSFLGAGCYDHYVPAAVDFILSQSEFTTAYTPYQAEISQGILQAIYEYQTYMCLLTGMDVSNASLFDGGSALAEAVLMALRLKAKNKIVLAQTVHPEYKEVLKTYLTGFDCQIKEIGFDAQGFLNKDELAENIDDNTACVVIQSPNFLGLIEQAEEWAQILTNKEILFIMVTNPYSLALFKEPALLGVDIVCGDGQALGGKLNFGGPSFGFLAAKKDYVRQMPGRVVGKTIDKEGKPAYCLTLQTREQHIRREKATSNICSNQSLNAIGSAVFLSLMGKNGMNDAAITSFNRAHYLYDQLKTFDKITISSSPQFFNEFVWEVNDAKKIIKKLYKSRIIPGFYLGEVSSQFKNKILSCCTEKKTKTDIDCFMNVLKDLV